MKTEYIEFNKFFGFIRSDSGIFNNISTECKNEIEKGTVIYFPGFKSGKDYMHSLYSFRLKNLSNKFDNSLSTECLNNWSDSMNELKNYDGSEIYFCTVHSDASHFCFFIDIKQENIVSAFKIPSNKSIIELDNIYFDNQQKGLSNSSIKINHGIAEKIY